MITMPIIPNTYHAGPSFFIISDFIISFIIIPILNYTQKEWTDCDIRRTITSCKTIQTTHSTR